MNKNAFFKYVESRAQSAYGSAILVKTSSDTKYSLLIASETVPTIFGTENSFEFNILNAKSMGKVSDRMTLDDKEVEFLLHRDNIHRLESLKGKVLDFLYLTPDMMAWKFSGTISARPNDATADVLRGTYTIVPMSADPTPIMDARSLIQETIVITNSVPDSIKLSDTDSINIECDVGEFTTVVDIKNGATGNVSTKFSVTITQAGEGSGFSDIATLSVLDFAAAIGTTDRDYAIAYITVSKTGYAPWTTTVALEK